MENSFKYYEELLERVINQFYGMNYRPNEKGLISWNEPKEKEKKEYLENTGKELKVKVKSRYIVKKVFPIQNKSNRELNNIKNLGTASSWTNIYITELEDDFFYVVDDVKFGMAGGKSRTKYKIEEIKCSKCGNIDGNIIKKIDDYQIFIR